MHNISAHNKSSKKKFDLNSDEEDNFNVLTHQGLIIAKT